MSNHIVQSFHDGGRLSVLERLAIRSFLSAGHEYHLYTYQPIEHAPAGVILKDGAEILPPDPEVDGSGRDRGERPAASDGFRYKLLLDRGGWWVDTDVVCLRPFDLPEPAVLATERVDPAFDHVMAATSVLKQPPGSALMARSWAACRAAGPEGLRGSGSGPRPLQSGIEALGLHYLLRPHTLFSPVPVFEWRRLIEPGNPPDPAGAYAIHLWGEMWRMHGVDPDGSFPPGCLYERLKQQFPD